MTFPKSIFLVLLGVCFVSCIDRKETDDEVLPYVNLILADQSSKEYKLIERTHELDRSADLVFLGDSRTANHYSRRVVEFDQRDNTDAHHKADGLKDFAGETLTCIVEDDVNVNLADTSSVRSFRMGAVGKLLAALDTLVYISPYDQEGMLSKNSAKIVILGTPDFVHLSSHDFNVLKERSSSRLQIVSPLDLCLENIFALRPGTSSNVGIICGPDKTYAKLYAEHFKKKALEAGAAGSKCIIMPAERNDSLLYSLLDMYHSTGNMAPLDAVLVDNYELDIDALKLELAEIVSVMNESSTTYGRSLSPRFKLFDSFELSIDQCYSILRQSNIFTHNIALPQSQNFSPVIRSDESGEKLILIPSSYVQN